MSLTTGWLVLIWCLFSNLGPTFPSSLHYMISKEEAAPKKTAAVDTFFHLTKDVDRPGNTYVPVLNSNVYVYSAVAENTSDDHFYDSVVITGWEHTVMKQNRENSSYTCCFIYNMSSSDVVAIRVKERRDWSYIGRSKLEVKQFVCPNVYRNKQMTPISVTLDIGRACPKNLTKYVKVDVPVRQEGEKLAVCAKLVFGNISASSMVEWFEYQKYIGVSKVMAYTYKLNQDALKVMQHYAKEGLAEFYPFSLPRQQSVKREVGVKNFQSWNDEQIAVFDCQTRLAGYKYIGLYDMDEYVFSKKGHTAIEMIRELRKRYPNSAGFIFKTEVHASTWGKMDPHFSKNDMLISSYNQRTPPMMDRVKSIVVAHRMRPGHMSTHGFWPKAGYKKTFVPSEFATTKHYRSCRKEWMKNRGEKCYRQIDRVKDNSMLKVADKIRDSVKSVKSQLKLT